MQFTPIAYAWIVSAALLTAEHIGLWGPNMRVEKPWSYVMGVGTILVGCFLWSQIAQGPVAPFDAALSFALISTSGIVVITGYAIRARLARKKHAAELAGEVRTLTQNLIDNGGHDATARQSDLYRGGRRN